MTLFPPTTSSPLDEVYIALDLETTGLDPEREEIIEIGAVKFQGTEAVDTFETLVNPRRNLPAFITQLTGITQRQVDTAPPLSAVAGQLVAFLGRWPLVGHNVAFDLAFLARAGLSLNNPRYDTHDLASLFMPRATGYSLSGLTRALGLSHDRPHRALEDARACQQLFVALLQKALAADPGLLAAVSAIAGRSPWALHGLLQRLEESAARTRARQEPASPLGLLGLDMEHLKGRLPKPRPLQLHRDLSEIDQQAVTALLQEGPLARAVPNYEHRPQQVQMAQAVTDALNQGHHLMVEAGTGVGKSVAYLLPAMLFAVRSGQRVVISTNTINLQEQLVAKDIPALAEALREQPDRPLEGFYFTHLKGRANYLCFRRWAHLAQSGTLSAEDARMLSKTLVWLQDTATGDRAEINIPGREAYLWERLSASGAGECSSKESVCFLRTARARAEGAHIVVVNHALLLSDLASGGSVIPPYDHLIIDEAHHLEEEASRQFGYEVPWQAVEELAAQLGQGAQDVRSVLRSPALNASRREQVESRVGEIDTAIPRLRDSWGRLMTSISTFVEHHYEGNGQRYQIRITMSSRKQPGWLELEVHWEGFNESLLNMERQVDRLLLTLEPLESAPLQNAISELKNWQEKAEKIRRHVEGFVVQPDEGYVYWVTLSGQERMPVLSASPLNVAPKLEEVLFSQNRCVVLTSATLSVQESMQYMRDRVGLANAEELAVGSPFDFKRAALLLIPSEMPDPADGGYQQALQEAVVRVARASQGGVLVLFTSHAALRATRQGIKPALEAEGITVLAQGVDGSPRQLLESASASRDTVLLATSSLWEGVDLPGDLLRVVVLARLPFNVPTEPVFAARSEHFSDPFIQYAVPQAVLRFRQGFGRLIRSKSDRGVVVVLDHRILSKSYGSTFLRSLPSCTMRQVLMRALETEVAGWLSEK